MTRTQRRIVMPSSLARVREAAKRERKAKLTALLHHVSVERLRAAYEGLNRKAAAGVDGITWEQYGVQLEAKLRDLHARLHRGAYRAMPTRRARIPKPDGSTRLLGIAALEDKIVQAALVKVLDAIYETDFLGFSYGFRRGHSPHQALDALAAGLQRKKVRWVLDADIRGFFDSIDHGWLMKFVGHRIGDPRVLRLISKWLKAGVLEQGELTYPEEGTPQGATMSPLLANIYLHYVFDLWAQQWRSRHAIGDVVVVRYADDFVVGFERKEEAVRFQQDLARRLGEFGLSLHPDKTRLIRFGMFAERDAKVMGMRRPATFDFLGFTHVCEDGGGRGHQFLLRRLTSKSRMRAKLKAIKRELARRRHDSRRDQGTWLGRVLRGHLGYYAVPTNFERLATFRREIVKLWHRSQKRRSQRDKTTVARMGSMADRWLPPLKILHPWPVERFDARTRGRSRVQ
jgi:RNA-directed DNA polymerase